MQLPERLDSKEAPASLSEVWSVFIRCPGPWVMFIPALIGFSIRCWIAPFTWWDALLAGGIVAFWPFNEWLIHNFLLHAKPRKLFGMKVDTFAGKRHRRHHQDPWDLYWTLMDPKELVTTVVVVFAFWLLVMPTWPLGLTGAVTYTLLGLHYEWVHLLTHSKYEPKFWLWRHLRKHHLLHHFKNDHYWFGVSSIKADEALGTNPEPKTVPKVTELRDDKPTA